MPYTTHNPKPAARTASIKKEMSSAFLSFKILTNCGNMEVPVQILANNPITVTVCKQSRFDQEEGSIL